MKAQRVVAIAKVAALLAACGAPLSTGSAPSIAPRSAFLPRDLSGPCPTAGVGVQEFVDEVTDLRVVVDAEDMEAPVVGEGGVEGVTIEEVPAGEGRTVALYGAPATGTATWRGGRRGVAILPDEVTSVEVLLTRIADLSCPRTGMTGKRAFHTATLLNDGRVLLVGGAETDVDAFVSCGAGCRKLTASNKAELYDPTTGSFAAVATPLSVARMFHTATLLQDGKVVIAGGAGEADVVAVDAANPFPLRPRLPISTVEVFDPATGAFASAGNDPGGARVFAASATTAQGEAIITGGVPDRGEPVNDLGNALSTSTICGGTPVACRAGPALAQPRAGHAAHRIIAEDAARSGVYLWGGSVGTGGDAHQIEALKDGATAFALVPVEAMRADRNVFFAATTRYLNYRVLSVGGLARAADGTFSVATIEPGGVVKGPVFVLDVSAAGAGGIATGAAATPMGTVVPSFFGAAAPLPGASRALVAGGYVSLDFTPGDDLELYTEQTLTIAQLQVGGVPRLLRQPRGAPTLTAIGDGTILVGGGEAPVSGGGRSPIDTAEIFTDPVDPFGGEP